MLTYKYPLLSIILVNVLLLSCNNDNLDENESSLFRASNDPVYESPLGLAADPSIISVSDTLFMYYSAADYEIGVVYSTDDGNNWISPDMNMSEDYGALSGQPNAWDQTLETVDVIKLNDIYYMYYTGYRENESDNSHVENYEIGLALSTNGIDFIRHPMSVSGPILTRDLSNINTNDRHAMTSPAVQYVNGLFYLCYTGWNVAQDWTGPNAGFKIIGATSEDGISWSKLSEPLITSKEISYSQDINESSLIYSPIDNYWYIPFSTDVSIGIARSLNFEGPYEIYPTAIVDPNNDWAGEVTAPDGIIVNGKMRLWYHGVMTPDYWPWVVGYSESNYPLEW